jgi:uncharacterized membrane protein
MVERKATPERLGAFSDGVLAIIITIMVLDLKLPHESGVRALAEMWPTFFSYALSYLFVGVVWINHHHLIRYTERAESGVIWTNLLLLFFVSLIPFFTAYMAEKKDSFATALYAGIFLLVTVAFMLFQNTIARQFGTDAKLRAMDRAGRKRNRVALVLYAVAMPAAYLHPAVSLAIIVGVGALYFAPDALKQNTARS